MTIITSIYRIVLASVICTAFTAGFTYAENESSSQPNYSVIKTVAPRPPHSDTTLKRVSENGGEVLVDGTMRVYEPIYLKDADFVEISTSVKPSANHVRLYAIAVGTYTVIKAQFDDGQEKVVTNN